MKKNIIALIISVSVILISVTPVFAADNDNPFGPHYVTAPTTITTSK